MFLAIWISCGAVLVATIAWRLRVAATTLDAILNEPAEPSEPAEPVERDEPRPSPEVWHHPPRRLWADR